MKQEIKQQVERKIKYFKLVTEKYYDKWVNETDDRKLFCNQYELIIEALEDLKNVNSILLLSSFNIEFSERLKEMEQIIKRFESRRLMK
jgi:hypothetical protein